MVFRIFEKLLDLVLNYSSDAVDGKTSRIYSYVVFSRSCNFFSKPKMICDIPADFSRLTNQLNRTEDRLGAGIICRIIPDMF
jgi:hypothetical protein